MNPLPAAGLIQLTAGARLPGFASADDVRNIVGLDVEEQLEHVVKPFYRRFGSKAQGADPGQLYMMNFLPGVAGEPESKVLGVASDATAPSGETSDSKLLASSSLSLGSIYKQNPGFDPSKKGYFTIGDVYAHIAKQVAAAGGKRVTVEGEIIDEVKTAGGCGAGVQMPPGFDEQARFEAELWPEPPIEYAPLQPMAAFQEQPFQEQPFQELQPAMYSTPAFEQPLYQEPEVPAVPEGFEGAYEISDASYDEATATAGGPGWGETVDPRDVVRRAQGPSGPTAEQTAVIKRGIKAAVLNDEHEAIGWSEVSVGNYRLVVSNSPIAVQGLRLPTSLDDAIAIGNKIGALPITPAISDARFASARTVYAQPLTDPRGALYDDPGQIVKYN
jgi:hypothetical protein